MTVTTSSLRPISQWRTPDAGTGRKDSRVTLLQMNAERQPCLRACRRLLRLPWTPGVTLDRMSRGPCPGGNSSVMTCRQASPTTALRTSWKPFEMSGITLTSLPKMSCAASLEASFCTRPKSAGFPVGIAARTASSSSSPTTSASSHFARGGAHNPSDPPPPPGSSSMVSGDAPAPPAPTQDAPPPPALCPQRSQGPFRSWHAPSPSRSPPLVGASGYLSPHSGASAYLPGCFSTLQGPSTSNWPAPFPGLALLTFLPCLPSTTASQQTAIQRFPSLRDYTAGPPRAGRHSL